MIERAEGYQNLLNVEALSGQIGVRVTADWFNRTTCLR
jgi:hypothetical protein